MTRDLFELLRRSFQVPWRVALSVLAGSLVACALLPMCGFGVLLYAVVLTRGVQVLAGAADRPTGVGLWAAVPAWPLSVFAVLFGSRVVVHEMPDVRTAVVVATSMAIGALAWAWQLAAVGAMIVESSFAASLGRVLLAASERPWSFLVAGALHGSLTLAPPVILFVSRVWVVPQILFLEMAVVLAVCMVVHTVLATRGHEVLVQPRTDRASMPRLRGIAVWAAIPHLFALGAIVCALGTPVRVHLPCHSEAREEELITEFPAQLDASTGAVVDRVGRSFEVHTADGGGFLVPGPLFGGHFSEVAARTTFRGQRAFAIGAWEEARRSGVGAPLCAFVAPDGTRLDDTLADRASERLGGAAPWLAIAGLAAFVAALILSLRGASRAAALDAEPTGTGSLVALHGRLHLGDGGLVTHVGDRVRVEGEVRVDAGEQRIAIAPGEYPWAIVGRPMVDGAEAYVVTSADVLRAQGYRVAPSGDAVLFGPGALVDARAVYLARVGTRLVWLVMPAAIALTTFAIWVLARV